MAEDQFSQKFIQSYSELRLMAQRAMSSERSSHTLQPTALISELWVKVSKAEGLSMQNEKHFFAQAAHMLRQILVDHARKKRAEKRGSGQESDLLEDHMLSIETEQGQVSLLDIEKALVELGGLSERAAQIVELRFFAGFSNEEIAEALELSLATVKREWRLAKAFLQSRLGSDTLRLQ